MKQLILFVLILFSINSTAQSAKEKILSQINSGESFDDLQEIFDNLKTNILGLESFTDPYYLTNKGLEAGTEDPCSLAIYIEEKSLGQRKRQRNIIYSFRVSDIDLDSKWPTNADIISIPFVDKSVDVEVFKGAESKKRFEADIIDIVSPEDKDLLIDALIQIAEFCETH